MSQKDEPAFAPAMNQLQNAVNEWERVEQELIPKAQKGEKVPDLHNHIQNSQMGLADALDNANFELRTHADQANEHWKSAINFFSRAMVLYNGIIVGLHMGRAQTLGEERHIFQRVLREGYILQLKAQEQAERKKAKSKK